MADDMKSRAEAKPLLTSYQADRELKVKL